MSTFRGIVAEFPDIRIDYFRLQPNAPPALACFLSHIHSDHLQGLEGYYGGPFIYCSEATKELLIRLERRAHRVNYAKQLVEARSFTHAEKRSVLRTIPLETPTWIELGNGKRIKVTLFDANHCPGAVMFLIENEVHSILYTGDIRAEPWWVEYVARHPVLIPYTMGIRRLSCIYLDTSFYAYRDQTTETFNTKAEGIRELISTMLKYPKDTTFHFNTWTFGYEDVWVAMAAALDEKIHVDRYQHRLFRSIRDKRVSSQGPFLNGYAFGNTSVEGKLTNDPSARIHSCDRNLECEGLKGKKVVWIVPLVNRVGGVEVNEVGIGQGDLESHSELSLDDKSLEFIMGALGSRMTLEAREMLRLANHSRSEALPLEWGTEEKITFALLNKLLGEIAGARKREEEVRRREMGLGLGLGGTGSRAQAEEVKRLWESKIGEHVVADDGELLPTRIAFPYARHSSHEELRNFVGRFRPMDICPCVVDEVKWSKAKSMRTLFGDLCSGDVFAHDGKIYRMFGGKEEEEEEDEEVEEGIFLPENRVGQVDISAPLDTALSQIYSDGSQRRGGSDDEGDGEGEGGGEVADERTPERHGMARLGMSGLGGSDSQKRKALHGGNGVDGVDLEAGEGPEKGIKATSDKENEVGIDLERRPEKRSKPTSDDEDEVDLELETRPEKRSKTAFGGEAGGVVDGGEGGGDGDDDDHKTVDEEEGDGGGKREPLQNHEILIPSTEVPEVLQSANHSIATTGFPSMEIPSTEIPAAATTNINTDTASPNNENPGIEGTVARTRKRNGLSQRLSGGGGGGGGGRIQSQFQSQSQSLTRSQRRIEFDAESWAYMGPPTESYNNDSRASSEEKYPGNGGGGGGGGGRRGEEIMALTSEREEINVEDVVDALGAALGEGGRSWWDVRLTSTTLPSEKGGKEVEL